MATPSNLLFSWADVEKLPELGRLELVLDTLPGALLASSPGGTHLRTSSSASRIPGYHLRESAPAHPAAGPTENPATG